MTTLHYRDNNKPGNSPGLFYKWSRPEPPAGSPSRATHIKFSRYRSILPPLVYTNLQEMEFTVYLGDRLSTCFCSSSSSAFS